MSTRNVTTTRRKAQPPTKQIVTRYGWLLTLAARRGYSQRALLALALSTMAADAGRQRKAVSHA